MTKEVEVRDQTRVDEFIWRYAAEKSSREIAEMTGEKPEYILRRKRELLEEVDELTIQQVRQAVTVNLHGIVRKTQADYENSPMEFKSGLMNSAVSAMKLILTELNRAEKNSNGAVEALNALRVRELLQLIDRTVNKSIKEISKRYNLEEAELSEIFQGHLMTAAQEMDEL